LHLFSLITIIRVAKVSGSGFSPFSLKFCAKVNKYGSFNFQKVDATSRLELHCVKQILEANMAANNYFGYAGGYGAFTATTPGKSLILVDLITSNQICFTLSCWCRAPDCWLAI